MKKSIKQNTKSRLIALDIDGTILDRPAGVPVHRAVREAVQAARAAGARVCLCSSRPCYFMEDAIGELGDIDALVGCSGAAVEAGGKSLYLDELPLPLRLACFEVAKRHNFYLSYSGKDRMLVREKDLSDFSVKDPALEANPVFVVLKEQELFQALHAEPVSCSFIFTEQGAEDEIVLGNPIIAAATVQKSSESSFVISNRGTDKGTGLRRLAEYWGIPPEAVLAIGNDANDVPMFEYAGIAVAVANAGQAALAAADWIAPNVCEGGAAAAIRRYALLPPRDDGRGE